VYSRLCGQPVVIGLTVVAILVAVSLVVILAEHYTNKKLN
jgi:hypothetical protein